MLSLFGRVERVSWELRKPLSYQKFPVKNSYILEPNV